MDIYVKDCYCVISVHIKQKHVFIKKNFVHEVHWKASFFFLFWKHMKKIHFSSVEPFTPMRTMWEVNSSQNVWYIPCPESQMKSKMFTIQTSVYINLPINAFTHVFFSGMNNEFFHMMISWGKWVWLDYWEDMIRCFSQNWSSSDINFKLFQWTNVNCSWCYWLKIKCSLIMDEDAVILVF